MLAFSHFCDRFLGKLLHILINYRPEGSSIKLIQNDNTSGFSGYPTLDLSITGVEFGTNGEITSISFQGEKFDPYWTEPSGSKDNGMEGKITFGEQDKQDDISFSYTSPDSQKKKFGDTIDFGYKITTVNPIDFENDAPTIEEGLKCDRFLCKLLHILIIGK